MQYVIYVYFFQDSAFAHSKRERERERE